MSADFWMGFSAGLAFLVTTLAAFIALSKRMSAEHRKANEATMELLIDANAGRANMRAALDRVANSIQQQGGRK
jgi:hypothetical protein